MDESPHLSPDDKATRRATIQLYLNDRIRTIEQIKRLYAVVIGLATASCFRTTIQALKALDNS